MQPPFKIRNSKCCSCSGEPLLVAQTALLEISCSGSCMDLLIVLLRNAITDVLSPNKVRRIYTMHNKFSNFLCFASFFVLIFVQCRSISIAMMRTGS